MGFFDGLSNALNNQAEKNIDYFKQKVRNASDVSISYGDLSPNSYFSIYNHQ